MGRDDTVSGAPFCSDASTFASLDIPTILFGPGSIDQAHAAVEYVECTEVEKALGFIRRWGGGLCEFWTFPFADAQSHAHLTAMETIDEQTEELVAAHIKFALALHNAYSGIGASVKPVKLEPGSKSRRETLLKQINQLQHELDQQWYSDCPTLAQKLNSIYLNKDWAKEAAMIG